MQISGNAAIVTGGASGLGEATARQLAQAGAKVAIFDRDEARGSQVAAAIGGQFYQVDVTSDSAVDQALDAAQDAHGVGRILVNCAGIAIGVKTVARGEPHPLDSFRKVIDINLVGTFNVISRFAARLLKADPLDGGERGVIINTASVAAFEGQVGQAAYAASKGGVVAMTLTVARDLADKGVRSCAIAPGLFLTPMLMGLPQEVQDSLGQQVPFPSRLGKPEEYAALAQHIVENQMLNGDTIRLDGAIRMAPR